MELLDWLASPEGLTYLHDGLEGLIYTVNEDGTYTLTKDGEVRFSADIQVPEEQGGGLWQMGSVRSISGLSEVLKSVRLQMNIMNLAFGPLR